MSGAEGSARGVNTRRLSCKIIDEVLGNGAFLNLALKDELRGLCAEDRRFTSALVMTTLENLLRIDYIIKQYTGDTRVHKGVKNALRIGVCQLLFFESVPQSAAVNESVSALPAKDKRQRGFANAVLRKLAASSMTFEYPAASQEPTRYLSVLYSYPEWLCEKYIADYGFDFAEQLLSYKKTDASTCVRANTLKASAESVRRSLGAQLAAEGKYVPDALYIRNTEPIESMALFKSGKIAVQSEAAMLCVLASGCRDARNLLDACAAPGGKSAYAGSLSPTLEITALDAREHREELMRANLARLGVSAQTAVADAREDAAEYHDKFEVVLIDAPCSALGLMYRKPDIRYSRKPQDMPAIIEAQRAILDTCAAYVAVGGTLLYSTCTINIEENDAQVAAFLEAHPNFSHKPLTDTLPPPLCPRAKDGMLQLFPHIDGIDGFFMAALRRNA